jgi:DNA repair ATPase RecN
MKLTVAKALKEKNKKLNQINKLWARLGENNSILEGNTREFNPEELLNQIKQETEGFIQLKTKIHNVCVPVREKIFRLSELKCLTRRLKSIDTKNGAVQTRYENSSARYVAHFSIGKIDQLVEALENEIDQIQEELDQFNHTNYLE